MQGLTASEFFNSSGDLYDSDEELDLEDVFPNKLKGNEDDVKEISKAGNNGSSNTQTRPLHSSWDVLEQDDFIKGVRQCHNNTKTKNQDSQLHQSWSGTVQVERRNRKDRPSSANRSLNTSWHTLASADEKRMIKSSCLTPPRRPRKVRQRDDHDSGNLNSLRSLGSGSHHSITEHDETSSHIDLDESKGSMNSSGVSFGSQSLIDGGDDSGGLGGSNRSNFSLDKSASDDGPSPRRSRSRPKSGRSSTRRSGGSGRKSSSRSLSPDRFSSAGSSTKSTERRSQRQDSAGRSRPTRSSNGSDSKKRLSNRSRDLVDGGGSDSDDKQESTSPKPLTRIRVSVENPDVTEPSKKQTEHADEVVKRRSANRSSGSQKSRTSRKGASSSRSKKSQQESQNSESGSRSRSRTRQSSRKKPITSAVANDDGNVAMRGNHDNDTKQSESKNLDGKKQRDDDKESQQIQGSRIKLTEGNDNKAGSSSKASPKPSKANTTEETQKNRTKLRLAAAVSLSPKFMNNRRQVRGLKNMLTSNNLGGSMRHLALSSDDDNDEDPSIDDENNDAVAAAADGGEADTPPPRRLIRRSSSFSELEEFSNRGNMAQLRFLHKGEAVATIEDVKLLDMSKSTRAALGVSMDD